MSDKASFFSELKRRNVYKVAVAYAVVGWLLVQVATQVFPFFEIPSWAVRLIVLGIVIGFPIALFSLVDPSHIVWASDSPYGLPVLAAWTHARAARLGSSRWRERSQRR